MVVTYYIKVFRTEASKHFHSLMSLLLLDNEKTQNLAMVVTLSDPAQDALPIPPVTLSSKTISKLPFQLKT